MDSAAGRLPVNLKVGRRCPQRAAYDIEADSFPFDPRKKFPEYRDMKSPKPTRLLALIISLQLPAGVAVAEVNKAERISPDVYFHEGDIKGHGHCNNGWIIFEDYVLVIDGNFPSGAQEIIPKIKAITDKPIRFAFDTHHHGDHAYGNQVWVDNGAVPVAHA